MADPAGGTQTVERAISLLTCFTEELGTLRVSELCTMTGLGQSTVSRMMSSLDRLGFVLQDQRTGLYRLGPAAISLGTIALNGSPIFRAARQVAQNLAHATGLGVNVAQLSDLSLYYLCNFEGANAPKSFSMAGRSGPLHATGMGKALLSGMSAERVDEYFSAPPVAFTPHTIVHREAMETALDQIRSKGYSTEIEELAFGRACIAAPIRNRTGECVAALSASGPLSVIDLDGTGHQELALQVIEAADEVSVSLGFSPSRNQPRVLSA
ncbi:IclR family transcriptional regulator [Subtercola lobariae]|uniref:Glycerol operon regulatory protein n=1 Tax=Subtercola lobariae TaxID=1588641 RepID=A0A917BFR2_9MICO|nr:IclR family transcriptional regulator [Subtercola lobariae]GGF41801.1 transcriptional regulator [Subtercola lobariae]